MKPTRPTYTVTLVRRLHPVGTSGEVVEMWDSTRRNGVVKLQGETGNVGSVPASNITRLLGSRAMPIQCTCPTCGASFPRSPKEKRRYCSPGCRPSASDRFWSKVDKNGPVPEYRPDLGPCWLWTAYCNPNGYGRFNGGRRPILAHRWSYIECVGPVGDGLELDHLCRVPRCCNPSHLEPVPHKVNSMRGVAPGVLIHHSGRCKRGHEANEANVYRRNSDGSAGYCRQCHRESARKYVASEVKKPRINGRGEQSGNVRLTEMDVRAIRHRAAAGESQYSLAAEYRVHRSTIHLIVKGTTWSWLT